MCLYPRLIRNPRQKTNPALITDSRMLWVPIGCGRCYECKRQKAQAWRVRLMEELKVQNYKYFITLTFDEEHLKKYKDLTKDDNEAAGLAIRQFLERYRKKNKKSLRHWLITELGQTGTERLHIHGVIFRDTPITNEELHDYWKNGRTDTGQYCNERTINYIIKYVTKLDPIHKEYNAQIFCSSGIGSSWLDTWNATTYQYKKGESKEYYTLSNGRKISLPIYYRNHLYNEIERIKLWRDRLDKDIIWVNGIKVEHPSTNTEYYHLLQELQQWNEAIGYGKPLAKYELADYKKNIDELNINRYDEPCG